MPSSSRSGLSTHHVDGSPTTLFHTTTRPRPLLVLDRRAATQFEMVIDLRDDDGDADRPLLVVEWGIDGEPDVVIDLR